MACCRSSSGVSPKLLEQIREKLVAVSEVFGKQSVACVVSAHGELLYVEKRDKIILYRAKTSDEFNKETDILGVVGQLRRAAGEFVSALGDDAGSTVVYVRGSGHLFSCFDCGLNHLVVYTEMMGDTLEMFDTRKAEDSSRALIEELALLLGNAESG